MKVWNYFYVIIVSCLTFTIFTYAPIINQYYFYLLAILLMVFNRVFNARIMLPLMVYAVIVLLNTYIGDKVFQNIFIAIIELSSLFIPVSILLYLLGNKENKTARLIVVSFFVLTIFTTIVSIGIDAVNPGIIRLSTIYHRDDDADSLRAFYAMGLSNYFLPHGLCILIPPLTLFAKYSKITISSIFYIVSLVAVLVLIYISGSTTSLLLSIISFLLSLFLSRNSSKKKNYRILIWALVIFSPIVLSQELQLFLLKQISTLIGDSSIYQDKLIEFESVAYTGKAGTDMTIRADLLMKTLKEFFMSPIWGTSSEVGGHNAIIDRLAALGIIGIIPLFLYFKRVYLWARPFIDNKIMPYAVLSIFNGLVMLLSKNMMCWEVLIVLFLIMPTMFYLKSTNKIKNNETNVSK